MKAIFEVEGKALPWLNFVHPGDPIAYPLEGIEPVLLGKSEPFVKLTDELLPTSILSHPLSQSIVSILNGGKAHGSYWKSQIVAERIGQLI